MHVEIEPNHAGANRLFDDASYQTLLQRFCFFQSPRTTPMPDDLPHVRSNYVHVSGHSSPVGFPFYSSGSGSTPRPAHQVNQDLTPRREYDSAQDAFNFSGQNQGQGTPRAVGRVGK
jgi:hypothetical protein